VGITAWAATPSESISARRTPASQQLERMRRNSLEPTMITASDSDSIRSHGSRPAPPVGSGQPFGT
jgi:hypothetical protein